MKYDVFISYASDCRPAVAELAAVLDKAGVSVWWDHNLLSGDNYTLEIQEAIRQSRVALVVWNPASVSSEWVLGEVKIAHQEGKLVAAKTPDVNVEQIPPPYNTQHIVDLYDRRGLFDAIEKKLDRALRYKISSHLLFLIRRRASSATGMAASAVVALAMLSLIAVILSVQFDLIPKSYINKAVAQARTLLTPCMGKLIEIGSHDDTDYICSVGVDGPAEFKDCANCPLMVALPEGHFLIGSHNREIGRNVDEEPQKPIFLSSFAIGKFEVTEHEWSFCQAAGQCDSLDNDIILPGHPAQPIKWNDAKRFVEWLKTRTGRDYRLPTEAEWEYAARGTTTSSRYWGESPAEACRFANIRDQSYERGVSVREHSAEREVSERRVSIVLHDCDDGFRRTSPVGSFEPNAFMLHDVIGNVWEWTQDCATPDYTALPRDGSRVGKPGCTSRSIRGGSYASGQSSARSANRYQARVLSTRMPDIGLRITRSIIE